MTTSETSQTSTSKQTGDTVDSQNPEMPPGSQRTGTEGVCTRKTTVCVGLLFVLLVVVTGLCVRYGVQKGKFQTEKDQLLTERSQLQIERDQLRTSNSNMTAEKKMLQTERVDLLTNYSILSAERNQLQTETERLRINNSKLATKKKELLAIKDQQQARIHQLETPCETGWVYLSYRCFLHGKQSSTWYESRMFCQARGADLVVINTDEKQTFIGSWTSGGWIGLKKIKETWTWVDNTELGKGYWVPGQPNSPDENCVAFLQNHSPNATWHDYPCDSKHYFTCEKNIQHY